MLNVGHDVGDFNTKNLISLILSKLLLISGLTDITQIAIEPT